MFSGVLIYFVLLGIGGVLSYKGIVHDKLLKRAGQMQMVFLYMLIFVMGIRLGMNREVIETIGTIGFKSGVFAVLTALGGVLGVFVLDKTLIKGGNNTRNEGRNSHDN
ncbi:Membrane protein of unknown function [Dethiosulfatibacter aminovorans DSM 17477]|uniref:Lysine exporter LysO n=1 Tax=Dethiosulfatibacter aminovorans DSM 17477 TaxID=1121476 RepID=A0A1M6JE80_9FIRM|nr:LysO family transporter [Dethiosulfatibacter aminovorans]SHJ44954.1 Membrane protein of unknown function [Dethiosulfatibacter aminovorans DSM 17477]